MTGFLGEPNSRIDRDAGWMNPRALGGLNALVQLGDDLADWIVAIDRFVIGRHVGNCPA